MKCQRISQGSIAERDQRRRTLLAKIASSAGLPEDDPRPEALSWLLLGLDNAKTAILRGQMVELAPWQELIDRLVGLTPRMPTLNVHFVDTPPLNLALLTDDELTQLETLTAKAHGRLPSTPLPENERPLSEHEHRGLALGSFAGAHAEEWQRREPTPAEEIELRGLIGAALFPLRAHHLFRAVIHDEQAEQAKPPSTAPEASAAAPAPPTVQPVARQARGGR